MSGVIAEQAVALLVSTQADDLWSGLTADGYVVDIDHREKSVTVKVRAGEGACADCLVPRQVLEEIVRSFLRDNAVAVDGLELVVQTPGNR